MSIIGRSVGSGMAAVGLVCLFLGAGAYAPPSGATAAASTQPIAITGSGAQHWSYGQFDIAATSWITANSRDQWGSASVPYSLLPSRVLACVLHDFAVGHFVEVVWQRDCLL